MFPENFYLSYSKLSTLAGGVYNYKNRYILNKKQATTPSFTKGTGVDLLIDNYLAEYSKKFAVLSPSMKVPSESSKIYNFIKYTIENNSEIDDIEVCYGIAYERLASENGDKKLRDSIDKFIDEFKNTYREYYEFLIGSKDKIVISFEESLYHKKIASFFKFSPYCTQYFPEYAPSDSREYQAYMSGEIEVIPKLQVEGELFGIPTKLEYDRIIVNHSTNTITPVDYKTTSFSSIYFQDSYFKFRYDLQNAIYSTITKQLDPGAKVETVKYLVVNTEFPQNAVSHSWGWDHINSHIEKDHITYKDRDYPTVKKLVDDLKFYYEHGWDVRREVIEKNGNFTW